MLTLNFTVFLTFGSVSIVQTFFYDILVIINNKIASRHPSVYLAMFSLAYLMTVQV